MHEKMRDDGGKDEELSARTELIQHYNCGTLDESVFDKKILSVLEVTAPDADAKMKAKDINTYLKKELIHKRNLRMAERVLRVLDEKPHQSLFFAFGTGQ